MDTASKLRKARVDAGFGLPGAADLVSRAMGMPVSREMIRRLETGEKDPMTDPVLVAYLFDLYERNTADEAPEVSAKLLQIITRLERHAPRKGRNKPVTRQNRPSTALRDGGTIGHQLVGAA